jgi:7-keto-8-aminopelargonate synthetase-like enzyme
MTHRHVAAAHAAGVIGNTARGANGRYVTVDDRRLLNFGSCSYMALESRSELRQAAHQAIDDYGTQFHFSRAFLECPLYVELEAALASMTGRPVLVAASTTLGHMAALPVLIKGGDSILIDQFAHASLHMAIQLVPGVPREIVRHNRMDRLEAQVIRLAQSSEHVWYIADGLYSMLGDFAPFAQLKELLARHPQLRLYIDDAHSTSWVGKHGRGAALEHFVDDERVVVALSLNKAFSAAGGALAVTSEELKSRIRRCGGPMLFSGPVQPPMLGAAVGSAKLHLSDEFPALQAEMSRRLEVCLAALGSSGLEIDVLEKTPIFQAQCDSPRVAFAACASMKDKGYYCCVCVFPAVPVNRPGIRFTMTRHNAVEDIAPFVVALEESIREAVEDVAAFGEAGINKPRHSGVRPALVVNGTGALGF